MCEIVGWWAMFKGLKDNIAFGVIGKFVELEAVNEIIS